jgi:hypothetical protein
MKTLLSALALIGMALAFVAVVVGIYILSHLRICI